MLLVQIVWPTNRQQIQSSWVIRHAQTTFRTVKCFCHSNICRRVNTCTTTDVPTSVSIYVCPSSRSYPQPHYSAPPAVYAVKSTRAPTTLDHSARTSTNYQPNAARYYFKWRVPSKKKMAYKTINASRQLPSVGYLVENRQQANTFNTITKCCVRLLGARKSAWVFHPVWPFAPSCQQQQQHRSVSLWITVHSALRAPTTALNPKNVQQFKQI